MGSVEDKMAALVVGKWEALAISSTDIDGPLSTFARGSLIRIISDTLENYRPVLQPEIKPEKRRVGRPKKCQFPQLQPPQPQD
jgi:hypothetical protein